MSQTTLKDFLRELEENYQNLKQHQANYAGAASPTLLSQINDHALAIALTKQAIEQDIPLDQLQTKLRSFNLRTETAAFVHNLSETPPLPGLEPPSDAEKRSLPPCPYRGLFVFRPEHADSFFGRDTFTQKLVRALENRHLVTVLGAAGSGKSSLVFAGLVPALDASDQQWCFTTFRPGDDPFLGLAGALVPLYETDLEPDLQPRVVQELADNLREGRTSGADLFPLIHRTRPNCRLLFIVDQFEEIYTRCRDQNLRHQFLDTLLQFLPSSSQTSNGSDSSYLVLTLRTDLLSQTSLYRPFAGILPDSIELLGSMTQAELREAIEKPAELQGVTFESDLVDQILADAGDLENSLPLLEFALTKLWQHQYQRTLTVAAYNEIGRVPGALNHHADQVYQALPPTKQKQTRSLLVQLVNFDPALPESRRRLNRTELEADWPLVTNLARKRLVAINQISPEQETVELIHELLLDQWDRLQRWLKQAQPDSTPFQQLQKVYRVRPALIGAMGILFFVIVAVVFGVMLYGSQLANELFLAEPQATVQALAQQRAAATATASSRLPAATPETASPAAESNDQNLPALEATVDALTDMAAASQATAVAAQATATASQAEVERLQFESESQSLVSLARSLALVAPYIATNDSELATLLTLESLYLNRKAGGDAEALIDSSVRKILGEPFFKTRVGNPGSGVLSVAFSPNGSALATGGVDQTIRLWDLTDPNQPPAVLASLESPILSLAFSPAGQQLAGAGAEPVVRVWDLTAPEEEPRQLSGHTEWVLSVAFSSDGQSLATGSIDQTVRLWNLADEEEEPAVLTRDSGVLSVAFSPDGQQLAAGGENGAVWLWDLTALDQTPLLLSGHQTPVLSMAFSPDGQTLAAGSEEGSVQVWNLSDLSQTAVVLNRHQNWVLSVAFSPDGSVLATGSADQTVQLWSLADLSQAPAVLNGQSNVWSVAFSPQGQRLAAGTAGGPIWLWNLTDPVGRPVLLNEHTGWVFSAAFSPNGQGLVTASADQTARLWDLTDLNQALATLTGHNGLVLSAAFHPDGERVATGSADQTVRLWNLTDLSQEPVVLDDYEAVVSTVAFSPDGERLATGSADGSVHLWSLADLNGPPIVLSSHQDPVFSVAFSPDGQQLATGSTDQTVRLWDLTDLSQEPVILEGSESPILSVAFSPDSSLLAAAGEEGLVRLWDVTDLSEPLVALRGHVGPVLSVAFSPEGQRLASAGADQTVRLWNLADLSQTPAVLTGHLGPVSSVDFSPDGQLLVTASRDQTARVWIVAVDTLAALACQQVRRNLTLAEWEQYLPGEDYRQTCPNLPSAQTE